MSEQATFGAGCFWGVEAAFRRVEGVLKTSVGFCGGHTENPTYKEVCSDKTGHAEVVHLEFDPQRVSYTQLLDIFWDIHDPTQYNRQGPDRGTQYRSVIFTHTPQQQAQAIASRDRLQTSAKFNQPIVTQIETAAPFYLAEDYHQQYLEKRGSATCHI